MGIDIYWDLKHHKYKKYKPLAHAGARVDD
jgi:hypothetical protein